MNNLGKNLMIWATIAIMMVVMFNLFNQAQRPQSQSYSVFMDGVLKGQIESVRIQGQQIIARTASGQQFTTFAPDDSTLIKTLMDNKVQINAEPIEDSWYMTILVSWFPMLLLIGVWIFFMRQMQGGGGGGGRGAMNFGRSKARLINEEMTPVTFEDVAGVDEAKEELAEVVDFLREPKRFTRLGGRIPKGVLLVGPPGTGKTLLARAVAGEAGVPFFSISGSDFVEMFVGVGASRVRDLFAQGKKNAPCLIFIDEIDAVGRQRGAGLGGGHDEREQTLNQLLVEMDGFESNEGVILVAATNRPDVLDPALLRPGRFDRQVVVPTPDLRGRERILIVHTRKVPLGSDVNLKNIARGTPGSTGADLENLVNEAALGAAKLDKDQVESADFEEAKDKVLMGKERRSLILSDKEKRNTAYHEGGHALMAKLLPEMDPVHKVTIIPRGRALGLMQQLPAEDRYGYNREFLNNQLAVMLGGRVAEEIVLNQMTTGASNDIERATQTARNMVCSWGMSDKLGPVNFGENQEQIFLGKELSQRRNHSESTAKLIDGEVREILDNAHKLAHKTISENRDKLEKIAEALLERETITGDDLDLILEGKELPPVDSSDNGSDESGGSGSSSKSPGYEPESEDKGEFKLDDPDDEDGSSGTGTTQ